MTNFLKTASGATEKQRAENVFGNHTLCIVSDKPETDNESEAKPILTRFTRMSIVLYDNTGEKPVIKGQKIYDIKNDKDETTFVIHIWNLMDKYKTNLVTYGGRSFIIPRMRMISMRDGLKCNWLNTAGDKWTSFATKFNPTYHADMMEILSDYGQNTLMSFDEMIGFLNIENNENKSIMLHEAYVKWKVFAGK